ncbi:MAG TPA: GEVED domain-containing protein [Chitinophagaceae bacterium]|nr:GEVED domain-containing protein [Chitinophagaceae bacterium]
MQQNFTQKNLGHFCTRIIALALILSASTQFSFAQENPAKANKMTAVQKAQQRSKALQTLKANPTSNNDAGVITKAATEINNPAATCTTFTYSVVAGDPPSSVRSFRDGIVKTCAAPGTCGAPFAGSFHYQIFQWVNPVAQCVTVTFNATNANFSFVSVYNAPVNFGNLCSGWVSDPGSSATVGTPIVFSFNGTAGTTYYFLVTDVGTLPANGTIQIDAGVCSSTPCAGTPNPGNTTGPASVCPTVPFTLGLQTPQNFAGINYQWEQSTTGIGGPWSNAPGASTSSTYTTSITVATAYRCRVTCTNSGITTISNPINVTITPPSGCYCAGGATDVVDEKISRVRYNTIDNASTSQSGYEDFTAVSTTVIQGSSTNITVDISNFFSGDEVRVWIDFNQNGSWNDPGERVMATVGAANPAVGSITIPVTATVGPTRMRVRLYWAPADADPGPCGNTAYGQVEDYTVNIQPCIQGVFNTHPANQSIQCGGTANFSVTTSGSLLTYGWEYKTSAASPFWLNVTNGGVYSGATTNTLTLTNVPQSMNGYVYRATIIGPCTAQEFSNVATLTVTPLIATVSPPSATICTGTIQQLTITNITSAPTTTTFTSGAISVQIPDLIGPPASPAAVCDAGINHSIPVALPLGSVITRMDVKLNITHTYVGDLKIVLKAPNNSVLNLDYHKSGTGTAGANFVNTIFSSAGVNSVGSGAAPGYTGIWKADASIGAGSFADLSGSGPTGFPPTVTTFPALWTGTINGNWTLAINDAQEWAGDIGTLTNWSIDITYVAPVFATGVWTAAPAAPNTMWINAGATIPYVPGTPQTTIWVNPTVNTNYSVVVTTATCVSPPTVVPVSVTNPITALVAPVNKTVCVGTTATFTVSAGGGPLTYQWEVSTNNGLTWTAISGATAATLTLTGVTQVMNNNLYRVTVTASPCGSSTTAGARLNVNQLPVVTLSSSTLALVPGRVATLTATSSPAPFSATSWSWTLNGSAIAGANTNTVTANIDQQGAYQATVTDVNGCVGSSNIVTIVSEVSGNLWIYPNPNTGQFQVRLYYNGAIAERRIVRIYNSIGGLVAQKEFDLVSGTPSYQSLTFNLGLNAAGTYAVKVVDKNGGKITSGLVVIQ